MSYLWILVSIYIPQYGTEPQTRHAYYESEAACKIDRDIKQKRVYVGHSRTFCVRVKQLK